MSNLSTAVATLLITAGMSVAAPDAQTQQGQWVHGCWGDESGALSGGVFWQPVEPIRKAGLDAGRMAPGDNRLDMVFVGDGYTAAQLGLYHNDVANVVAGFFIYEPFTAYEPYFRITTVDVISNESGVDHDPSFGIFRDTALDMNFWCSGIERLLCVNVGAAYAHANAGAADVDQVLAVANSSKYGGAGYSSSNLGTLSGQNAAAVEVAIHEMGHSLGDLADEYTYGGSTTYSGPEPSDANVSIFDAPTMASMQTKWWQWAGSSDARFDSPVGHYEGAHYSQFGIYRPSNNSMMRALYRKFNAPSAESLIAEIYQHVSPIDDFSPDQTGPLDGTETVSVTPMQPVGHSLTVAWTLDGALVGANTSLDLTTLSLGGTHTLVARVVDPTNMVVDQSIRDSLMTETVTWTINAAGCTNPADLTGDNIIDAGDLGLFINFFLAGDLAVDFTNDGIVDAGDLSAFINFYLAGC